MLDYLKLNRVGPAPELEFDLSARLNLLTGDNGLGKSFLLDTAWWALTRTWTGLPAAPHRGPGSSPSISFRFKGKPGATIHESVFDWPTQSWSSRRGRPTNPGMVLYARVDGGFCVWDPARNGPVSAQTKPALRGGAFNSSKGSLMRSGGGKDGSGFGDGSGRGDGSGTGHGWGDDPSPFSRRPSAFLFDPQDIWNGLPLDEGGDPRQLGLFPNLVCNGLLRDWVVWQLEDGEAFLQLKQVMARLSPPGEALRPGKPVRIGLYDVRDIPTFEAPYGQMVPVLHASAGIKRILAMTYLLVWTWQEHQRACALLQQEPTRQIVFLIDEIEAHLHPKWQRVILRALLDVMNALTGTHDVQIQVLAATHSPLLLASVEPLFDPSVDALWLLEHEGDRVTLRKRGWERRGDANGWLTSDVFDLREPRSLEAERAIQSAMALVRKPAPALDALEAADEALRQVLPDLDPVWVRWSAFLEARRGQP